MTVAALLLLPGAAAAKECRYEVAVSDATASELNISIRCDGGLPGAFSMAGGAAAWAGTLTLSDGTAIEPAAARWEIPESGRADAARYVLPLRAMAEANGSHEMALAAGDAVYAALDAWLVRPEPADGYILSIRFTLPNGGDVATGLFQDGDKYRIAADDVRWAGPTLFGTFERLAVEVPAPGALAAGSDETTAIDLAILGPPMSTSATDVADWVANSARVVAEFWRGFPVERPLILLVPVDGNEVTYGRVDSTGGITVLIQIGRDTEPADLYQDWVLIHEMLHLGSPYIRDAGPWLNEGIATLYEPIVRMRAGWKTREEVWLEWIEWMPYGLRAMGPVGLAEAEAGGIYWGGALFLLLAEIEVRDRTNLALGVENCLRAVRDAGGTVDADWTTQQFLDFCDETLGGTILADLAAKHLGPGEPPDLDALWASLGVSLASDGTIRFDDTAPLADVRDAILSGGPNARWQPVPLALP